MRDPLLLINPISLPTRNLKNAETGCRQAGSSHLADDELQSVSVSASESVSESARVINVQTVLKQIRNNIEFRKTTKCIPYISRMCSSGIYYRNCKSNPLSYLLKGAIVQ